MRDFSGGLGVKLVYEVQWSSILWIGQVWIGTASQKQLNHFKFAKESSFMQRRAVLALRAMIHCQNDSDFAAKLHKNYDC